MPDDCIDAGATTDKRGLSEKSRANLLPFQKGKSGNPGGRPKVNPEVKELAKKNSKRAMARIIELMDDEDPRIALMAAKEVLDRALGKVGAALDEDADTKSVTINIVRYADRDHATPQLDAEAVSVRTLALS